MLALYASTEAGKTWKQLVLGSLYLQFWLLTQLDYK